MKIKDRTTALVWLRSVTSVLGSVQDSVLTEDIKARLFVEVLGDAADVIVKLGEAGRQLGFPK